MDAHSVVDDWETAPFDGGFGGLDELASRGFSGAVEAGGTWLFFRDGEALAVVSDLEVDPRPGDIDAFEGASGQRHAAPNRPVATLAPLLALDGEVRGRYFTDDTPLDAVDETLTEGGFTGYVELSENVLSGEYYYAYVDGEVEHVGFVGASELLVGEEAERKATGEVGIYAVVAAELPRPELPEPPEPEPEPEPDSGSPPESDSDADGEPSGDRTDDAGPTAEADTDDSSPESDSEREATARNATPDSNADPTDGGAAPAAEPPDDAADPERSPGDRTADATADAERSPDAASSAGGSASSSNGSSSPPDRSAGGKDDRVEAGADQTPTAPAADPGDPDPDAGGIEAVTTRTVPSLDPENSGRSGSEPEPSSMQQHADSSASPSFDDSSSGASAGSQSRPTDRAEKLREEYESRIETYETRIEELETELADAESRIEELETELESLRDERDDLRERLEAAESDAGSDTDTAHDDATTASLSPIEALSGTSLFVRATSRGDATLEDARDGSADRETVAENLRIEYHTEFEDEGTTVEGEPFESWLRSSETYTFVEWLLTELFFEIRSTDAIEGLRPLYEALPKIDRIGFEETLSVGDGEAGREVDFDIVARNKKGNPVVVVAFDRQRDPTRAEAIEPLVTDASDVCQEYDSLAGAVAITSSYFESDARAAVEEATSTSLLSRSKYRSYVKLSRTSGYHLCLAEFRDGSFNLTHPDL